MFLFPLNVENKKQLLHSQNFLSKIIIGGNRNLEHPVYYCRNCIINKKFTSIKKAIFAIYL